MKVRVLFIELCIFKVVFCILVSKMVSILCTGSNVKRYKRLGYDAKINEYIQVNISDVSRWARCSVNVVCDYCGANYTVAYYSYVTHRKNYPKDCCSNQDCINQKRKESVMFKYGKEYVSQLDFVREKVVATNLEKYGSVCGLQSDEVHKKTLETMQKKYGCNHPMHSEQIKNKIKNTCLEKYGVENPLLKEEIMQKAKATTLERYGTEYPMQNEEIRNRALKTRDERNGINGAMTSSEQIYLWKLYGGEINAPMFGYLADILFEDEHIYIEYSGSGHNIRVTYNKMTQEEFDEHEEFRRKVFLDNGYKEFEIISKTDKLPNDNYLYKIKNEAFTKLKESNCVYYGINIDTGEKFYK